METDSSIKIIPIGTQKAKDFVRKYHYATISPPINKLSLGLFKDNKTSFAFRLVFQSYEKTLTDDEVNTMMETYYKVFKDKGYEIR